MKVFNIRDFGARVCDMPQTKAIQSAIDACFLAGGFLCAQMWSYI